MQAEVLLRVTILPQRCYGITRLRSPFNYRESLAVAAAAPWTPS